MSIAILRRGIRSQIASIQALRGLLSEEAKRDRLDGDFEAVLQELKPAANLFNMAFEMLRDLWVQKEDPIEKDRITLQRQITRNKRKPAQLVDRLVDAETQALIEACKSRFQEIEGLKLFLTEQLTQTGQPTIPFGVRFEPPSVSWQSLGVYELPTA